MSDDVDERKWTVRNVADYLQVSIPAVYVLIQRYGLPCTIVGKNGKRFSRESVDRWFREREVVRDEDGNTKTTGGH